jgi:L-2-amino-thiazoline-4-carboxylic acid hydrolase
MIAMAIGAHMRSTAKRYLLRDYPQETVLEVLRTMSEQASRLPPPQMYPAPVRYTIVRFQYAVAVAHALESIGVPRSRANEVARAITWESIRLPMRLMHSMVSILPGTRVQALRRVTDTLFATVFASPFQRQVHLHADQVAFTVTQCPIAEWFSNAGHGGRTSSLACALDYSMASIWNASLHRTATIAAGDSHCDFCFRPAPQGTSATMDVSS